MKALIILFATAILSLFIGISGKRSLLLPLGVVGTLAALGATVADWFAPTFSFPNMLTFNHYALAFTGVVLLASLFILLLSGRAFQDLTDTLGDHYGLIFFSLCGAVCMFAYDHLVMLFLGIEILSIPLYVLAGSRVNNLKSSEAALKYFLMGAFATGILLFGTALVYGATGHFDLVGIQNAVATKKVHASFLLNAGILMMMFGLSFKVSAAPFHFWSPDVYEGSPSLITAFMATVVKTAGFAAFYKLFTVAFGGNEGVWSHALAIIAALTMTVGNLTAVFQTGFKRMMAYSSIAHAGYLILGILGDASGSGAIFLYLMAYSIATICAFAVFMLIDAQHGENSTFASFNGLGYTKPLAAIALTVSMISLAGIPITAGFFGKYMLFTSVFSKHSWLVIVAVLNSAVSIYYYFRVIIAMYFTESSHPATVEIPTNYQAVLVLGVVLIVAIALIPTYILNWVR